MATTDQTMIPALLLVLWLVVAGTGLLLACLVGRWLRRRAAAPNLELPPPRAVLLAREFRPALYQQPGRWLAIRNGDPARVLAALGLHDPRPCSWEEGLASSREHKLFISPRISGWVLVLGSALPDPGDDVDACFHFLANLSRQLGHVQYFNADRILSDHAWIKADSGHIRRAYAWAGATLWDQGPLTLAESDLGLACFPYGESPAREGYGIPECAVQNVERIPALASRWSINPAGIDERILEQAGGIAGETTFR